MKRDTVVAVASLALFGLGACGDSTADRAISGGAIGAETGAIGGAVTGESPVNGALIGGAVGAADGAPTDQANVDLGQPVRR